ncbi:hypothetical protein [Pedobacter aquatilis]|uniref:hypothetical protein n=1 Tax=Pedobacter aquatilis TaxID=351343 RepID=UPI002930CCE0|nr:hypothetical protein [Pedobacter aquatilis]
MLSAIQFGYYSTNVTKQYGGKDTMKKDDWGWVGYPGRALSSIYINAWAKLFNNDEIADCIVVGFKHWVSPALAFQTVRSHYIMSTRENSIADLVKAYPGVPISASLIPEAKAERLMHWAMIVASAKKKM